MGLASRIHFNLRRIGNYFLPTNKLVSANLLPSLVLLIVTLEVSACAKYPPALSSEPAYEIVAVHSGKCLDVEGSSADNDTRVLQWECHSQPNQLWKIIRKPGDVLKIVVQHSGKCLSTASAEASERGNVVQQSCYFGGSRLDQEWKLRDVTDWSAEGNLGNRYQIVSSSSGKCLDVEGSVGEDGASVLQYDCAERTPNQLWRFVPSPALPLTGRPPGTPS